MFTSAAVQRAMNTQAEKWGAPPGYYSVQERVRKLSFEEQVWDVKIRLFGGRIAHHESVVFIRDNYEPDGPITYASVASRYEGPGAARLAGRSRPTSEDRKEQNRQIKNALQEPSLVDALMRGTPWTHSEDDLLRLDAAKGIPLSVTARKLGRTYFAVGQRRVVIGATTPRPNAGRRPTQPVEETIEGEARV
jgi:hypothetical protein